MNKKFLILFTVMILAALVVTPALAEGNAPGTPRAYLPLAKNDDNAGEPLEVTNFAEAAPGETFKIDTKIRVNLAFIGYDPEDIDEGAILDMLPATYEPVVRYPQFYGLSGRDMGLRYFYRYRVDFLPEFVANDLFTYMQEIGTESAMTAFQGLYNDQENNVLDVTDPVLYVDGPSVEQWLNDYASAHVPNFDHSYTIFFINWYGRDDFKFHVYTKTDFADPDTEYNFGELRGSRKMIAWGGGQSRVWLYDLSAGPESWSSNYDVDNPDLDGNGVEDYRMPPIWEYTDGGYRDPSVLSSDLASVARFVAINLLFTSSPLYDPVVTTPDFGGNKVAHIEMFQDDPASNGMDWITEPYILEQLDAFQPYHGWDVTIEDNDPIDANAERAFRIFSGLLDEDDCWNAYGTQFAELFCYFDANLDLYIPPGLYDLADYVGGIFAFNTTAENLGWNYGLLGFADDNWVDGTQSYVFEFDSEDYRSLGYGFSTTTVHEFGHHIGMSHPHDGYDSEYNLDYGPSDDFYFAWSGDESNTIMHYMDLSGGFGQFDQDNMYRYETAAYANWSNVLLGQILADPGVFQVAGYLSSAQTHTVKAATAYFRMDYLEAVTHAKLAYEDYFQAALQLGIPVDMTYAASQPTTRQNAPLKGDPIRFPDN